MTTEITMTKSVLQALAAFAATTEDRNDDKLASLATINLASIPYFWHPNQPWVHTLWVGNGRLFAFRVIGMADVLANPATVPVANLPTFFGRSKGNTEYKVTADVAAGSLALTKSSARKSDTLEDDKAIAPVDIASVIGSSSVAAQAQRTVGGEAALLSARYLAKLSDLAVAIDGHIEISVGPALEPIAWRIVKGEELWFGCLMPRKADEA